MRLPNYNLSQLAKRLPGWFWTFRIPYLLIGLAFIGIIAIYVLEFRWFNRTLMAGSLARAGVIAGVLAGAYLAYRWKKTGMDITDQVRIYLLFIFLGAFFFPLFLSLTNRILSPFPTRLTPVEFVEESGFYASAYGILDIEKPEPNGYHLFFYEGGQLHRIRNEAPHFLDRQRGDTISLRIKRGLFGYRYVVGPE